jgi:hypothetical protein
LNLDARRREDPAEKVSSFINCLSGGNNLIKTSSLHNADKNMTKEKNRDEKNHTKYDSNMN